MKRKARTAASDVADPANRNIRAVADLEEVARHENGLVMRYVEPVAEWAARPSFILGHTIWFATWTVYNVVAARPFDPYPFSLLTLVVSLEAILLTSFVLMTQDRMTREADRRAQIDLQVDLLAEQELTAILKAVCLLGAKAGVDLACEVPEIGALQKPTDIQKLAAALERGTRSKHRQMSTHRRALT